MRILVMILASDTSPEYLEFQTLMRTFIHKTPGVDCYFYKAHPNLTQDIFLCGDTLMIKMDETFDTIYDKTLRAFDYFSPKLNHYDFIYRTNLSTYTHYPTLIEYCKSLPTTNMCAGSFGGFDSPNPFPGGSGILLTPDLVIRLLDERPEKLYQDDVTIGAALKKWNATLIQHRRGDYENCDLFFIRNWDTVPSSGPRGLLFSWRLKTQDRSRDVDAMRTLITRFPQ
jgi:hypothetical protein